MEAAGGDNRNDDQHDVAQDDGHDDRRGVQGRYRNGGAERSPVPGRGHSAAGKAPRAGRPPELLEPGWRVGRCLGQGGSATVWLVERPGDRSRYALKLPRFPAATSGDFELRRELAIHSRYRHENLVGVHGFLATAEGPGLLMEYAAGGSLLRLVDVRGTLSNGEAVTVLVAVARAVACLHAEGSAHGDVAPGNVLFTANGKPMLADLGTGRMLGESRNVDAGTPGFSAPSAPGQDTLGTEAALKADVYALGALGWFMLTGRPLVPGLRPPLRVVLPRLPDELRDLLDEALDDDPARRPAADRFAADMLRAWPAEPLDLLAAVHPSVRQELRTRRSAHQDKETGRRRERMRVRRSRSLPWEEPGRQRRRFLRRRRPSAGAQAPAGAERERPRPGAPDTAISAGPGFTGPGGGSSRSGRGRRAAARPSKWLAVATAGVSVTLVAGAVSLLAPDALQPVHGIFLPADGQGTADDDPAEAGTATGGTAGDGRATATATSGTAADPAGPGADGTMQEAGAEGAGGTAEPSPEPVPTDEELSVLSGDDPVAAVRVLAQLRSRAFAEGQTALLSWVNQPGSAPATDDLAQVDRLQRRGERLSGLSVDVTAADRIGASAGAGGEQYVALTVESSAFVQIGTDGLSAAAPGAATRQDLVLEVVRTEQGWRILRVFPAAAGLEPGESTQR